MSVINLLSDFILPGFIFGGVAGLIGGAITGLAMIPILLNLGNRRSTVNDLQGWGKKLRPNAGHFHAALSVIENLQDYILVWAN